MNESLLEGFERPLLELCTDERLRQIEGGVPAASLWDSIDALGYTDMLVAEEHGGAGLSLADAFPLLFAAGRAGFSFPFSETIVARAMLAQAGYAVDRGCIAMATAGAQAGAEIVCRDVPGAVLAKHVLVSRQGSWLLLPCERATLTSGTYRRHVSATLKWTSAGDAIFKFDIEGADAESVCNAVHAAGMAGAMARVLALTVEYARDRRQFGKSISQFQAIQQELAVLAAQVSSAAMAARLGCQSGAILPNPLLAATAKLRACEAAVRVCVIAHAVHGAIGITEEHILGIFTARLHEWRISAGSEGRCAAMIGVALLSDSERSLFDFVREKLAPA
jgi:alkylation response protein AidB-like acyl-CoA dehydrogenase